MEKGSEKTLDFLRSILKRPGMFGINKVEDFNLIIMGYYYGSADKLLMEMTNGFNDFINHDFNLNEKFEWPKLIRLYSGSDGHSIQLFIDTFERFLKEKYDIEIV